MQLIVLIMLMFPLYVNAYNDKQLKERVSEAFCQSYCNGEDLGIDECKSNNCSCPITTLPYINATSDSSVGNTASPHLTVVCKDADRITLSWKIEGDQSYFLQFTNNKTINITNVTLCGLYTIRNLMPGTQYSIWLWNVSFHQKTIFRSQVLIIETPKTTDIPLPATELFWKRFQIVPNGYDAIIGWKPDPQGLSCQYNLIWFEHYQGDDNDATINNSSNLLEGVIENVQFDTNYTVILIAQSIYSFKESPNRTITFTTPTCLERYRSLKKCAPSAPTGMKTNETFVENNNEGDPLYNVNLKWKTPEYIPDYYLIDLRNNTAIITTLNITGNDSSAVFERVNLFLQYHIVITAWSEAGPSQREAYTYTITPMSHSTESQWSIFEIVSFTLGPFITICLIAAIVVLIRLYFNKQRRVDQRCQYFNNLDEKVEENNDQLTDEWELDEHKLSLQTILGEGAFGIVRRAFLEMEDGSHKEVAVKMLKETPTLEEIRQFSREIEIMKSVKQHPCIVSLIGCIMRGRVEGPLLAVEYCSRGDLQTYLRTALEEKINRQNSIASMDGSTCTESSNYVANKTYGFSEINSCDDFLTEPKHLLSIGRQVVMGMEHLSQMRVVHRDLAARNVLVCKDHTVKVSDFGLSRDVYQDNVYCKMGSGKLPIRWMALESLTHQRYTTQSDVWSFGILLWEIMTLGGTPYAGIHSTDLLDMLKAGERLQRPNNCCEQLFSIMQSCWRVAPKERPTFTELRKMLEFSLENITDYLSFESAEDSKMFKLSPKATTSSERYVRPISKINS